MADKLQAQKLAAARKMLKEYKRKTLPNRKSNKQVEESCELPEKVVSISSGNITPAESLASSTQSATNLEEITPPTLETSLQQSEYHNTTESNTSNYFNNSLFNTNESNHILSNYFDILPANTNNVLDAFKQNQNQFRPEDTVNVDNITAAEAFQSESDGTFVVTQLLESEEHKISKSECALDESVHDNQNLYSNTESLRQLSSQINSLISPELVQNPSESSELERRNQELAAMLENERLKNEQLNLQLREYLTRITHLESETQQIRNEHELKLNREIGPLQEQLQYHIQTVGILVGEKTELTMALNQSQTLAKQKTTECDELHNRLKASKYRVSELEKELNNLKSVKENLSKNDQEHNREFEKLKLDYNLLNEQHQDSTDECLELHDKLNVKLNECLKFQQEIQEKNSQLSLAQLKIEQLTNVDNLQIESQLEMLNQQKILLEQQVIELTQTVKSLSTERGQANLQYQQYVQQLNGQIQNLADSLATKTVENESLAHREQSLISHISELEMIIQQLQYEKQNNLSLKTDKLNDWKKMETLVSDLQMEKTEIEDKYRGEMEKHELLREELDEKLNRIAELEMVKEQLSDQPDAAKLLAVMESDKVAASRAVEQNIKLKEQLEELHDGFIKISDSKLQLTEELQSEQHKCRELADKLSQASTAIEHLHSVIAIKDKELTQLQLLSDRLRHYEAQGNVHQELKTTIDQLSIENDKLKEELVSVHSQNKQNESDVEEQSQNTSPAAETNAHATELKQIIEKLEKSNIELLQQMHNSENVETIESEKSEYLDKEKAMEKLEERFKNTMAEVANLTEEKQRLEHLVLQLQSETETIGEYVALYQCQRAMLKEKTLEKDVQLKRLAHDREEMQMKLEELNTLVKKLVIEKGLIPSDILPRKLFETSSNCEHMKENTEPQSESKEMNGRTNDNNNDSSNTAGKIISLLSEIKTSHLVQPGDTIQNFHPCPWCSGQLLNV